MRRKVVFGLGLAGLLTGSAAVAQFASPGTPTPPPFGGAQPAPASTPFASGTTPPPASAPPGDLRPPARPAPGLPPMTPAPPVPPAAPGYVPPVGGFNPTAAPATGFQPAGGSTAGSAQAPVAATAANADMTALGVNHPWVVKPEHGAFFICVKSYSRPHRPDPNDPGLTARELAETLAAEVRDTYRTGVYLFEYMSDEKQAEMAAAAAARQRAEAFQASVDLYRQKSQLNGMEFLAPDNKMRYKTFNYRDQVAVLVGGFRTEDDAIKALAKVKTWPAPKNTKLLDGGAIATRGENGQTVIEKSYLNPFPQAMVVPNPTVPKAAAATTPAPTGLDPFVVKLNEGKPYSLLKATKPWTLGVKSFNAPLTVQSRETKDEGGGLMKKFNTSSGGDVLNAGAEQAEMLAKVLRELKGPPPAAQPLHLEAFVLHNRQGSIVTVGQFDGPNDPALLDTRRLLAGLKLNTTNAMGIMTPGAASEGFTDILPMPVPRR